MGLKKAEVPFSQRSDKDKLIITSMSSILAGGFARLILHPIDTIKAKLQVNMATDAKNILRGGILRTAVDTIKHDGFAGLYRGIGISTLGSAPALALYFTGYEVFKSMMHKITNNNAVVFLGAGFGAEVISCVFWVPIDVIKERQQVQSQLKTYSYKNSLDAFYQISKGEKLRGLYKGYGATLASFGPFSALYFFFYEHLKSHLVDNPDRIPFWHGVILSGLSGFLAGGLTNPLDMAKLRMQVDRAEKSGGTQPRFAYKNVLDGVAQIYKKEGGFALFRGSLARVLFHAPSTAISMGLMESIRIKINSHY